MKWLRALAGLVLLALVLRWVDGSEVAAVWGVLSPSVVAIALVLTALQVVLAAARWRLVARRLGQPLPMGRALRESYLASLLNQVLPGGVGGDALRAWRLRAGVGLHRSAGSVAVERGIGQFVLIAACALALFTRPELWDRLLGAGLGQGLLIAAAALALLLLVGWRLRRVLRLREGLASLREGRLLEPATLLALLALSILLLAAYLAVFWLSARAVGAGAVGLVNLLPLLLVSLLAMSIPLGFGGWGLREGGAALAWSAAGLPPAQGVAVALGYGVLVLLCSLPAALVLLWPNRDSADAAGVSR